MTLHAARFFTQPYQDDKYLSVISRRIDGINYQAYRPNHGLCHSLRQGFLARDIIKLISITKDHPMHLWVLACLYRDKYFSQKIAILSSFQRSGRQSEVSSSQDPKLYGQYEQADCHNFICSLRGSGVYDTEELELLSKLLVWDAQSTRYISIIIKAAHLLDLRRIPKFSRDRITREVSELLEAATDSNFMEKLWDQSGVYLDISGDRDMMQRKGWADRFFTLQSQPSKLYFALRQGML